MAKKRISSTDLAWIFLERIKSSDDCAAAISVAIVPSRDGWAVVTNKSKAQRPGCAARIEQLQKQLREVYELK
jgi:hypothetical protein